MAVVHPFSTPNTSIFAAKEDPPFLSLTPPPTPPKDTRFTLDHLPIFSTMSKSLERHLSDEELDREWKGSQGNANQRPQSTMARSFSLALNDLFKIDESIADLDAAVDQKKKAVSSQTSELEALEARLKATEERLKAVASNSPNRSGRSSPRPRPPVGDAFSPPREAQTSPLSSEFRPQSSARLNTKDGNGGTKSSALPPTPGASEGESDSDYVHVRKQTDIGEDGHKTHAQ